MKVYELIEELKKCNRDAYVVERELHGISEVLENTLEVEGGEGEYDNIPVVVLHYGLSAGIDG